MTQRYLLRVLCGNTLSWWKRARSLCTLTLKNTTCVWISRQMRLFIGLWPHLSAPVTMLPVLPGRGRICPTIGSSFSTPNVLSGLLCVRFWTMICRNANRITAKCSKRGRNCSAVGLNRLLSGGFTFYLLFHFEPRLKQCRGKLLWCLQPSKEPVAPPTQSGRPCQNTQNGFQFLIVTLCYLGGWGGDQYLFRDI